MAGSIRVNVRAPSMLELLDAGMLTPVAERLELAPGIHEVPLMTTAALVVVVSDR
jgi:hypothetical protein